jgi:hypothetical protein
VLGDHIAESSEPRGGGREIAIRLKAIANVFSA